MATTKIILRTERTNSKGEHPLWIRVIRNRKSRYSSLDIYLKEELWDVKKQVVKKAHPESSRLNAFIGKKLNDALLFNLERQESNKTLKEALKGKDAGSFFQYADRHLLEMELNSQVTTHDKTKSILTKIRTYLNGRDLMIDEIDVAWLKNYEIYLRSKLNNSTNTVHCNLKIIRTLINAAIREELLPYEKNPFLRYKLKWENVKKEFLTEEELAEVENLWLEPHSTIDHHRNMFVFSCYAGGLRISDVLQLRWKNFDGQRILVRTHKTGSNVPIALPPKCLEILERNRTSESLEDNFIFPMLKLGIDYSDRRILSRAISSNTAYANKNLKVIEDELGLNKHLHFHLSRHTWAVRALHLGMRIEHVSQLMGHSTIKMTQKNYANFLNTDLDDAMKVFG
jgi:integrase/recombinase XerD